MLDLGRLDPYVLWVLNKGGWTPGRVFPRADAWMEEIQRLGFPGFDYAGQVLRSLGGLGFLEYAPRTYEGMVQSWRDQGLPPERWPKAAGIRESCQAALAALQNLALEAERYTGATFTFQALTAARDVEIVLDLDLARTVIGKAIFPIGTVEPDGLVFAAPDHSVYVLFNDGIFSSGGCVEEFLHILFLRGRRPQNIYHLNGQENIP